MEIPFVRWYEAIWKRRSRRYFTSKPIPPEILEGLDFICTNFKPFNSVRSVLLTESYDAIFKGAVGNYGKIKGAPSIVAFVGDVDDKNVYEKIGYTGEGIILEATSLGLGTCWVGGFFRPDVAASIIKTKENEKVIAVTPVGYPEDKMTFEEKVMTGFGITHKRRPLKEILSGVEESKLQPFIKQALDAARVSPSAVNRQPWRFHVKADAITVSTDNLKDTFNIPKRIDCGIAMLHIEVALLNFGISGKWEFLNPPDVARFKFKLKY